MALAGTLSALRELILDANELPALEADRHEFYRQRFPNLSVLEVADLAKIPPANLDTYTSSIFRGERSVLRNIFPVSFGLMELAWPSIFGQEFDGYQFARELHRWRPWRGNATEKLAENFVAYCAENLSRVTVPYPYFSDCLICEHSSFIIRRHPSENHSESTAISPCSILGVTVDDLLQLEWSVPSCVRFEEFSWDIINCCENREVPTDQPQKIQVYAVGARDVRQDTSWLRLPASLYSQLGALKRGKSQSLLQLAEMFVDATGASQDEAQTFNRFLSLLGQLMSKGAIVVLDVAPKAHSY